MMNPENNNNDETEMDNQESAEEKSGVLESVMENIEMAGESMSFFEEGDSDAPQEVVSEPKEEEFIDRDQAFSIMESLLFSSDKPMGIGTFKQVFRGTNYKTKEIKELLEELQCSYAENIRGVSLEEINGGWQLRTKVDNMDYLRKLARARPFKLSGPALEVLSIIAYKQPLIKSEIDQIRGVESGHLVRALMEKGLCCFQGKSELPGKPMQYGTTRKFLEIFGLRNLRELPSLSEIDQLLPDGIGGEEEKEKLSDVTDGLSADYVGNYSEGEEELEKIAGTLGGIDTSSEFFEQEKIRQREKRDRDRAQDIREAMDVDEDVPNKDKKWLARYDQKIAEEVQAAQEIDGTDVVLVDSSEDVIAEAQMAASEADDVSVSDELASLSDESLDV